MNIFKTAVLFPHPDTAFLGPAADDLDPTSRGKSEQSVEDFAPHLFPHYFPMC